MPPLARLAWLSLAFLLAACPFVSARADDQIRSLRLGATLQYDRLVFELGPQPTEVRSSERDAYELEFAAAPPNVGPAVARKLRALDVQISPSTRGTLVRVETRGRACRAFRLPASPAGNQRVVLDVSRGTGALELPADALALDAPTTRPSEPAVAAAPPTSAERPGSSASGEQIWVRVGSIVFEGLGAGGPTREDLLNLELAVRTTDNGDLVAAPEGQPSERKLTLRELSRAESAQRRLGGSVLQQIVERVAAAYEMQGKFGARIDITRDDLKRLLQTRDGVLTIRIAEAQG